MTKPIALVWLILSCLIPSQVGAQNNTFMLTEKNYGNVAYVSGGIGDEERDEIGLRERDFNLKLLFSERDGTYLANVNVTIADAKGERVLEADSVGPFLLVRLPAASYVIKVSMNGVLQQKKLLIREKHKNDHVFRW